MQSKTSYFNKTIFCKDITRFWPWWSLEAVILLILCPVSIGLGWAGLARSSRMGVVMTRQYIYATKIGSIVTRCNILSSPLLYVFLGVAAALLVFRYLYISRDAYMIHSLPVSRTCLFFSHALAGLVILMAPVVLAFLVLTGMMAAVEPALAGSVLICMLQAVFQMLFFYGLACLVVMLSGNSGLVCLIYAVINFLFTGVSSMLAMISNMVTFGGGFFSFDMYGVLPDSIQDAAIWLTPVAQLLDQVGMTHPENIEGNDVVKELVLSAGALKIPACYLVVGVVFIAAAIWLYKKRPIESVGDMLAFSWCRPVFRIVFSLTGGMLLGLILTAIAQSGFAENVTTHYHLYLVLGTLSVAVCYLISDMFLHKSFFIWKSTSYLQMGVLMAVMLITVCSLHSYSYKPGRLKADKVETVKLELCMTNDGSQEEFLLTDPKEIAQFIKVQKAIYQNQKAIERYADRDYNTNVSIQYTLKDTTVISRSFRITGDASPELDDIEAAILAICNKKEGMQNRLLGKDNTVDSLSDMTLEGQIVKDLVDTDLQKKSFKDTQDDRDDYSGYTDYDEDGVDYLTDGYSFDQEEMEKIYQAFLKDVAQGNVYLKDIVDMCDYSDLKTPEYAVGMLRISMKIENKPASESFDNNNILITKECTNTIQTFKTIIEGK